VFSRVGFAYVNRKELEALVTVVLVELVEGRDLAHKGWSGDTTEFQEHVFLAAELREAYTISVERRELEIRRIVSSTETHLEVS
jgi:hypothetical protein